MDIKPYSENRTIPSITLPEPFWSDKKRPIFGLPLSFTRYSLFEDRLLIQRGFLMRRQEEIRLYRITDQALRQTLTQRIFGVGDIVIYSADSSTPKYILCGIRQPYDVTNVLSELIERERRRLGIGFFESLHT